MSNSCSYHLCIKDSSKAKQKFTVSAELWEKLEKKHNQNESMEIEF